MPFYQYRPYLMNIALYFYFYLLHIFFLFSLKWRAGGLLRNNLFEYI